MASTKVKDTTNWTSVKRAFRSITTKLKQTTDTSKQLAAIDYWTARLNENHDSIVAGTGVVDDPPED